MAANAHKAATDIPGSSGASKIKCARRFLNEGLFAKIKSVGRQSKLELLKGDTLV